MTLRKQLSIILACITFMSFNSNFAIAADEENTKEIDLMLGLGLMSVDNNGEFHPDAPFTRLEMAQLIANTIEYPVIYDDIAGKEAYSEKYNPWVFFEGATDYTSYISEKLAQWEKENVRTEDGENTSDMSTTEKLEKINIQIYDDVKVDDTNYDLINKVTFYNIMNGFDNNMFYPDSYIKSLDAAVTIINMLGYRPVIQYYGGYPGGYIKVANAIGLDIKKPNEPVTRSELAKMYTQAFDIGIMNAKITGADVIVSDEDGETILTKFMKLARVEGRIVQNEQTSLSGKSTLGEDGLQIGSHELFTNEKTEYAQKLIGRNVEGYYFKEDTEREGEVVYVKTVKKSREISFDIDDFIDYENNKIEYEIDGDIKTSSIDEYPFYIYNGVATTTCPDSYFEGAQGTVTLVSGNNSSKYDLIIIENYKSKLVTRAYEYDDRFIIVNKLSNNDTLSFNIDDVGTKVKIFTADKKEADILDIKADCVIDVMQNDDVIEIIISDEVIYDYELSKKSSEDEMIVSNGRSEYVVSQDYVNSDVYKELDMSLTYDLYINSFGKVAYIYAAGNTGLKMGYLMKFIDDEENEKVYAKIIVADKTSVVYELAEKIYFSNNDGTVENKRIKSLGGFNAYLDGVINQVIRYSLNAEDKITSVELALDNGVKTDSDNRLHVMAQAEGSDSDLTYYYANNTLGRKVYMATDTPILVVPSDTSDSYKYKIVNYNALTKGSRKMTAYGTNPNSPLADYVLYFDEASQAYTTGDEYLVCDVKEILNTDDEIVLSVDVYRRGTKSTLFIEQENDLYNGILPISLAVKTVSSGIEPEDYIKLDAGDVISCQVDTSNNITSAAVIFDADGHYDAKQYKERYEATLGYDATKFTDFDYDFTYNETGILAGTIGYWNQYVTNTNPFSTDYKNGPVYTGMNNAYGWHMGARRFYLGYVYSVTDDYVTVTTKNLRELGSVLPEVKLGEDFLVETFQTDRYWCWADISDDDDIKTGMVIDNPEVIRSYKEYGENCSRVLVCSGSTAVNAVFVINGNVK